MYKNIIIVILLLLSYCTTAQSGQDSALRISPEVVVVANRSPQAKKALPQAIDVYTQQEIRLYDRQTIPDVLANNPRVFVQKSQQGGGSLVLRGFEANKIVLVVDGVKMNNLIYRGGHLQNALTIDQNSLQSIEVLYGPASTLYGSDALGGVIHFRTRDVKLATDPSKPLIEANAFARYGSANNERSTNAYFGIGGQRFGSLTSFSFSQFGALQMGRNTSGSLGTFGQRNFYAQRIAGKDSLVRNNKSYLQVGSGYHKLDFVQKFLFKSSASTTHGLNLQYATSSNVPRYDRLTDPAGAGLRFADWFYGPQNRAMAAYDLNHTSTGFLKSVHVGLNYQNIDESRYTRRFGRTNLDSRIEKVQVVGLNLDLLSTAGRWQFHYGADAQLNFLKSKAKSTNIITGQVKPLDTRYPDGQNYMHNAGIYLSASYDCSPTIKLSGSGRLGISALRSTFIDQTFFPFPFSSISQSYITYSGSLGVVHSPSASIQNTFQVSSGFRAPNIDDLSKVFESGAGRLIIPNPNLKPEQTFGAEYGFRWQAETQSTLEISTYGTLLRNVIAVRPTKFQGADSVPYQSKNSAVFSSQNGQQGYIYGISVGSRLALAAPLFLHYGAAYTYGRIIADGKELPLDHIAPATFRTGLLYQAKALSAEAYFMFHAAKKLANYSPSGEDNLQYAPSTGMPEWHTINLVASYQFLGKITAQAGVDNILDARYRVFSSGINAAGRNVFFSLRCTI